jgi:hypothetical protein
MAHWLAISFVRAKNARCQDDNELDESRTFHCRNYDRGRTD